MNATLSNERRGPSEKGQLSKIETQQLCRCEDTIRRGVKIFVEVGLALREIRDGRLYREKYATFHEYLERWDLSRPYAYQVIDAAEVVEEMSGIPDIGVVPNSVSQARALLRLKEPEKRREAWSQVVEARDGESITAKRVREVVESMLGENGEGRQEERRPQSSKKEVACLFDNLESGIKQQDWQVVRELMTRLRQALQL